MRKLPDQKFKGIKLGPKIKTHRLFLAIFLPQDYISFFRDVLRQFDKQKRNILAIPIDRLHLNIKFVGANVSDTSMEKIISALKKHESKFTKPEIKIRKIQFGFPHQRDPRVLIADVENKQSLVDISNEVHNIIKSLGLRDTIRWKEKNSDDFHISIARLKDNLSRSVGRNVTEIAKNIKIDNLPPSFFPDSFDILISEVKNSGPKYINQTKIKI